MEVYSCETWLYLSFVKRRKYRNYELAVIQKLDPARLRARIVEPEDRKQAYVRSRRKATWRREVGDDGQTTST